MKYVTDGKTMKSVDRYTIEKIGIPSTVLMERAALGVAKWIKKNVKSASRIICVCGQGNNGADGVAVARILKLWGYDASVLMAGDEAKATKELQLQKEIATNCGVKIYKRANLQAYDIIVDAIFGIGLSRAVTEPYFSLINRINDAGKKVIAVDIASGICADTGRVMGNAVKADVTVTFGACKQGQLLGTGRTYSGTVLVKDAGFPDKAFLCAGVKGKTFDTGDLTRLPERNRNGNKGTFGKVLVVAGSREISGAACLCAESAYRSGAGLVKVITHNDSACVLKKSVPEALVAAYDNNTTDKELNDIIDTGLAWCDMVVIGPGIGTDKGAQQLVWRVLAKAQCPVLCDADALNILSGNRELLGKRSASCLVVTPHMGEMARLTGRSVTELKEAAVKEAVLFAKKYKCICVMKDARTVVADADGDYYINTSGNDGMAKGGSGDVLSGVIAGLMMCSRAAKSRLSDYEAVCLGVYIHGLAGDMAADKCGRYSMLARDMIKCISRIGG